MIGQIRGIILEKQPPQLLVEVQGVGYEIAAPMNTFYHLPELNAEVTLYTHFIVREDGHYLYGFHSREERSLFRTLLKVNGVGPRLGLTILSSIDPREFVRCVVSNDSESLVRLPGVGKKTAERLIIEMRDKLENWQSQISSDIAITQMVPAQQNHSFQDAISALIALGYKPQEASRVVSKVDNGSMNSEEIIRKALKEMVA